LHTAAIISSSIASPGLKTGRGLKQMDGKTVVLRVDGIARPKNRARIETLAWMTDDAPDEGIARPKNRARIETFRDTAKARCNFASPGLKTGRGLKLLRVMHHQRRQVASPGLKTGRGLKHGPTRGTN